jgi:hypothetical protein
MVQVQNSISKHLHHHTFFNILFNGTYETHHAQILSYSHPGAGIWLIVWPVFLAFWLSSLVFSKTFRTWLGLSHPSIVSISMCVHTSHQPMGIHFLCCVHGNECTGTHDAIHDTFAAIAWDVGFHVGWEQLHALPSTTFNSSCRQVDIVLTKNGIRTLVDVVIVDPTRVDLLPRSCAIEGFVAFDVTQAKERSYHNWHPNDQFLPLAVEVFDCLHKHVDVFLHNYANAIWSLKGIEGFHFSTLVIFFHQKVSITLQRM